MRTTDTTSWHPASWTSKTAQQQPRYRDIPALDGIVAQLSRLPPLVVSWEIESLRERIAQAQQGKQFLLMGGDCAETFEECEYQKIVDSIGDALDFFERVSGGRAPHEVTAVDFFASHEGLLMHYEQAQTRYIERQKRWYNLATHMPWIGMRTAQLDGAHVEFFRGIANPMGVKIGPAMTEEWLQGLITTLNPNNTPGRLTTIHRFG